MNADRRRFPLASLAALALVAACGGEVTLDLTETPLSATSTPTSAAATATAGRTATATQTAEATETAAAEATEPTPTTRPTTAAPTEAPTRTSTSTVPPTRTPTELPTATAEATPTIPFTFTHTPTFTFTRTPTLTSTQTPTSTPTVTPSSTRTATPTDTPSPPDTPTEAPADSPTPTHTTTEPATPTASSTASPTPTGDAGATDPPANTPTATPTDEAGAVCGNGVLEPGENADDPELGLVGDPDGTACPQDAVVADCVPSGETKFFEVHFAGAIGTIPTGATMLVGYDSAVLSIPGSGRDREVRERAVAEPPLPFVYTPNDFDFALRAIVIRTSPMEDGRQLTIEFDACIAEPTAADLACTIEGCSGAGGPIEGCTCSIVTP